MSCFVGMFIYLIRHAQTKVNVGGNEHTLTQEGLRQTKRIAHSFPKVDAIYSSNQHRALVTAQAIAEAQGLRVRQVPELQEIYACIVGGDTKNPRAERMKSDVRRADKALRLLKKLQHDKSAVVCHGNIIRFFIARIVGMPLERVWRFDVQNCSITALRVGFEVDIICVNDVSHLL